MDDLQIIRMPEQQQERSKTKERAAINQNGGRVEWRRTRVVRARKIESSATTVIQASELEVALDLCVFQRMIGEYLPNTP